MIGVFGGTFDPVHFGHIQLALSVFEKGGFDQILWIPAKINPLKAASPVSSKHRLQMLQIALKELPFFKILDLELHREGPSYTVDTLKLLKNEHPDTQFRLILGEDAIKEFHKWKNPEEIEKIAPPLVGPRTEISATDIRDRLSRGLYCGHLLPAKVLDYIALNGLYSSV